VEVSRRRKTGASVFLSQDDDQLAAVLIRVLNVPAVDDEVVGGSIAIIVRAVCEDSRIVSEGVERILADWVWLAGIESVRPKRVAAPETEFFRGAAEPELAAAGSFCRATSRSVASRALGVDERERE